LLFILLFADERSPGRTNPPDLNIAQQRPEGQNAAIIPHQIKLSDRVCFRPERNAALTLPGKQQKAAVIST
jgi:hypothetical protein